jgi:hypothetical protein
MVAAAGGDGGLGEEEAEGGSGAGGGVGVLTDEVGGGVVEGVDESVEALLEELGLGFAAGFEGMELGGDAHGGAPGRTFRMRSQGVAWPCRETWCGMGNYVPEPLKKESHRAWELQKVDVKGSCGSLWTSANLRALCG